MWRSCSTHILVKTVGTGGLGGLKYPVLPSGNSTLHDLHRLASFKIGGRVRIHSSHAFFRVSLDEPGPRPAGELVLSHAQRRTIFALSTPPGKAGVAVVRISGPDALDAWKKMVKPYSMAKKNHPEPWKMERCHITDPQTNETLDDGLAVFFKGKQLHSHIKDTLSNSRSHQLQDHLR